MEFCHCGHEACPHNNVSEVAVGTKDNSGHATYGVLPFQEAVGVIETMFERGNGATITITYANRYPWYDALSGPLDY